MSPMRQEVPTGPADDGPDRKVFESLLNTIISRRGCDARLSLAERHFVFSRVVELISRSRDWGSSDPIDFDMGHGRRLLELAVEQAFDEATNGDINRIIRRRTRPTTRDSLVLGSLESLHDNPADAACEEELQKALRTAIEALPEQQNLAIGLRLCEYGYEEIGARLGCSKSTAHSHWGRGVAALTKALDSFK